MKIPALPRIIGSDRLQMPLENRLHIPRGTNNNTCWERGNKKCSVRGFWIPGFPLLGRDGYGRTLMVSNDKFFKKKFGLDFKACSPFATLQTT